MSRPRLSVDEAHRRATLIVFLRDSEDLSFNAIAKRFGITPNTANTIYRKVKGIGHATKLPTKSFFKEILK